MYVLFSCLRPQSFITRLTFVSKYKITKNIYDTLLKYSAKQIINFTHVSRQMLYQPFAVVDYNDTCQHDLSTPSDMSVTYLILFCLLPMSRLTEESQKVGNTENIHGTLCWQRVPFPTRPLLMCKCEKTMTDNILQSY